VDANTLTSKAADDTDTDVVGKQSQNRSWRNNIFNNKICEYSVIVILLIM